MWDYPLANIIRDLRLKIKHGESYDLRKWFHKTTNLKTPDVAKMTAFLDTTIKNNNGNSLVVKYTQIHDPYMYYEKIKTYYKSTRFGSLRKIIYELFMSC